MAETEFEDVMKKLEACGTAQNRKVYKRHGAGENLFGVSFANLKTLKKAIKRDHEMARKLWQTGNIDAQMLATMIADPQKMGRGEIVNWVKEINYYTLVDYFIKNLVQNSRFSQELMEEWVTSDEEWIGRAGWQLLAHTAMKDRTLLDKYFQEYLALIERTIHMSKNRTKDAMNNALIAIGTRSDALETIALEVAERIGKVHVDHGKTSCKTPDAKEYIQKTNARKRTKR